MNDTTETGGALPPAILNVDLVALAANYAALGRLAAPAEVAGVVKANAYGLGVGPVAECLVAAGCRSFFVTSVAEGLELRSLQPQVRIFVLEGAAGAPGACLAAGLVPVLNTVAEAREWAGVAAGRPAALQLDTGIHRAGLDDADVTALTAETGLLGALRLDLVMTHLACADEPEHPLNAAQIERFEALRARLPAAPTSIGNSAGTLAGPAWRGDLVRPGIALYGGAAFVGRAGALREVARLEARVLQIRELAHDASVGYGATWRARAPARIATVGAGYADGYPRSLGSRGIAIAAGRRVPVAGRISMDLITVDVTALPPGALRVGDMVSLIGGGVSLDEVAELAGTVGYELLTRFSPRLVRRYSRVDATV